MEERRIRASLATLETQLERAREARNQIESEIAQGGYSGPGSENPEKTLVFHLEYIYNFLTVILEAAGLIESRRRLIEQWAAFEKNGGLKQTQFHPEFDYLESKPFDYLSTIIDGLRASTGEELGAEATYDLAKLEVLLKKTPVLVRNRGVTPMREHDVQAVMHDYLGTFFTEFRKSVQIPGIIKDFNPDCGIRNLKAAIEFKYAASADEVSRAIGGVFEDISGYAGSSDWTRFYTVIYQTEAFDSEDRVRSELTRAGALTWKAFLVTGAGSRLNRKDAERANADSQSELQVPNAAEEKPSDQPEFCESASSMTKDSSSKEENDLDA